MVKLNQIEIDFSSGNQNNRKFLIEKGMVIENKPEKKIGVFLKKKIRIVFHKLWIELTHLPDTIAINDKNKLITLEIGNKRNAVLKDFKIQTDEIKFQILLDEYQFSDFKDQSTDYSTLQFALKAQLKSGGSEKTVENYELPIVFKRAFTDPQLSFNLDMAFVNNDFVYTHAKDVFLGNIVIYNQSSQFFSHSINCMVNVDCEAQSTSTPLSDDILYLGDVKDIDESSYFGSGLVGEDENQNNSFDCKNISPNVQDIKNVRPKIKFSIPLYMNMTLIKNPNNPNIRDTYSININMDFWRDCTNKNSKAPPKNVTKDIQISRDQRNTKLDFFIIHSTRTDRAKSGSTTEVVEKALWEKNDPGKTTCFDIQFGNQAESGDGAVLVRNLSFSISPQNFEPIIKKWDSNREFFTTNNFRFDDAPDENETIEFFFFHKDISLSNLPGGHVDIKCSVTFDCAVIKDIHSLEQYEIDQQFNATKEKFEHLITFSIEKYLGPYWLALDYGTSAIVAAFAKNEMDKDLLLNLQIPLQDWVNHPNRGLSYEKKEIKEHGTMFLSSDILLQNNKSVVNTNNFFDNIILLSPTRREFGVNRDYFIPYLKSIIGVREVPDFNPVINTLTYYDELNNKKTFGKHPLEVKAVLTSAYFSILNDYIEPLIKNSGINRELLNKIVLTVPNSFTPRHTDYLKKLIKDEFSHFKDKYITFVSESDAVACYYYSQRHYLNTLKGQKTERNENDIRQLFDNDEYVLVYDMGAGTVDLTYFRISPWDENQVQEIEVLSKMGSCTAGNYFDYKIAKTIFERYKSKIQISFNKTPNALDKFGRLRLKEHIVDDVKRKLNGDTEIDIPAPTQHGRIWLSEDIRINPRTIRDSPHVKEYIKINTTDLFNAFFSLKKSYKKGAIPINTVILSGRGVQFNGLREQIINEIENWTSTQKVHYIDTIDPETLKSAVVRGAMYYAMKFRKQNNTRTRFINKNLHARYGFMYKHPKDGKWEFCQLLNPDTKHIRKPVFKDGQTIYQYDTNIHSESVSGKDPVLKTNTIDLSRTTTGYFVQSFSANTAEDYNNNKMDFITKMFEFDTSRVCPGQIGENNVPIRVIIDKNNQMVVKVNKAENAPTDPLQINLDKKENTLFMQSMWPYFD